MRGSIYEGEGGIVASKRPTGPSGRVQGLPPAMNGFAKAWEKVAEGDYGGAFKSVKQQVKKVRSRLPPFSFSGPSPSSS